MHTTRRTGAPLGSKRVLTCLLVFLCFVASGCFALTSERNNGVGLETNRASVVVYKKATKWLYDEGVKKGSGRARQVLADAAPPKFKITAKQRLAICAVSPPLCLSIDQIGRTIVNWFRSDVRTRSDLWEALSYAGRHDRCLAWTFVPSRNLTHKASGTAGCRTGVLI